MEKISVNEIREFSDNESNILPALRLSYHYLPSHLKQCFAFCSIFPKDYKFQRQQMVLLWMKENLLQQAKRNERMEDRGDECFYELVSRSFFQRSSSAQEYCFVMHNLAHELAKFVSREYCFTFEEGNSKEDVIKVRHLVVLTSVSLKRFNSISEATCLRTFLPLSEYSFWNLTKELVINIILKLRYLRVSSLLGCENMKQLSELIGELKLLCFLDRSRSLIESLPESISMEKALCLSWKGHANDSKHDREILEQLFPHTNLKILSIYGYGGTTFPYWLGDPSFCSTLIIRLENCKFCNCLPPFGQLPSLKTLYIMGLSGVVTVGAEFYGYSASNSMRKPFASLQFLSFSEMLAWEEWSSIEVEDSEVFPRLQQIEIYNCGRLNTADLPQTLPCSAKLIIDGSKVLVSSLPRSSAIQDLELGKCEEPQLQELQQTVESLGIEGCHGLESLVEALRESQKPRVFSHLQIVNCPNFTSFPERGFHAPSLAGFAVGDCKKLEKRWNLQKLHALKQLTITYEFGGAGGESFPEDGRLPSTLTVLNISGTASLKRVNVKGLQQITSLNSLFLYLLTPFRVNIM
ncbi:putative disease resistance RPP13-like protein 1 [Ziziphus jujuba]|uniref:Disease resistance RPP13-like protein 1 n=1 Tax=Ziziphus jujuba TaxID=326968 RepID=A0ABM3ZYD1_ZIZJJ|nr:putative disease resistance RPP13-like protein 1 [Ziziphus jujuba]